MKYYKIEGMIKLMPNKYHTMSACLHARLKKDIIQVMKSPGYTILASENRKAPEKRVSSRGPLDVSDQDWLYAKTCSFNPSIIS